MASERPAGAASVNFGLVSAGTPTSTYVPRGGAPLYRELVARIATENRYEPTPSQVHEWVMAGLLPKTPVDSLGWRRGFTSAPSDRLYAQLVALCRLHEVTKRTDRLRMLLWIEGWDVDPALVKRDVLARLAFLPKRKPYESGGMDALYGRMKRDAPEFVRRLGLHRVKGTRAIDGAYMAARLGFGVVVEVDRRSVALLVRAFGLDRALRDRVGDTGPWLSGDLAQDLLNFARMRPLTRIYGRVASLTPDDLEAIRPYARFLVLDLPLFARALEVRFGRNAFGFGGLRIAPGRPEYGIAVAAFFARTRLRRELRTLAREFAENRESMLAIVGEPTELTTRGRNQ